MLDVTVLRNAACASSYILQEPIYAV